MTVVFGVGWLLLVPGLAIVGEGPSTPTGCPNPMDGSRRWSPDASDAGRPAGQAPPSRYSACTATTSAEFSQAA
jgi:hypothetical protein